MEYQFTRGIKGPDATRPSLALSSVRHDSPMRDARREIAKQGLHKGPLYSPSNLTMPTEISYSQEFWNGPDAWTLNESPSPSRLASAVSVAAASHPTAFVRPAKLVLPPDSRVSSFSNTTSSGAGSAQSLLQSARASSATSNSNDSLIKPEADDGKKEKRATFKEMYKRASRSTRAFTRMFSRAPSSNLPSSGVAKHSSPKLPMPLPALCVDPFASGSSASSFGLSPPQVSPRPSDHKRTGSSPEAKSPLSVDVQTRLQRSPSVSSPLGIPASPSLTRVMNQPERPRSIRGRDPPFPINSSNISLPLFRQRSRSASQCSVISAATQVAVTNVSQDQARPPLPRMPSSTSLGPQTGQLHAPQGPLPHPPVPTSISNSSGTTTVPSQRPRSRSMREVTQPMVVNRGRTEPPSHQSQPDLPRNPKQRGEDVNIASVRQTSFLNGSPPTSRFFPNQNGMANGTGERRAKTGAVVARKVHVVTPSPSMPSMRAAYLETSSTVAEDMTRERPRTGSARDNGALAFNPPSTDKLRSLPVRASPAIPHPAVPSTHKLGTGGKSESVSSRDPSLAPPFPRPPTLGRPSITRITTQNLPPLPPFEEQGNQPAYASRKNTLRKQSSILPIPRSPSLPSLRPGFTGSQLPSTLGSTSHDEESRGHSHVRSPSLPTFPVKTLLPLGNNQEKATRQPLPSGIAERLRNRARSSSRSDDKRPSTATTSTLAPPPLPTGNGKPSKSELIPSSSTYDHLDSSAHPSDSTLSTASNLQSPPSPTTSRFLGTRIVGRPRASSLKSPSMPDLRAAANLIPPSMSSRHRLPRTPPPPLPQAPSRLNVSVLDAVKQPSVSTTSRISNASRDPTVLLRSKPSLLRSKEHSYPPLKDTIGAFHARSNKEMAEEGDWDFLDRPPRPLRTPSVAIPATPTLSKLMFSHAPPQPIRDFDVPPAPTLRILGKARGIEMAL